MRLLHNSLVSMLIVTALAWSSAAHAERRIVIIHDPGPQGPSLEMSTQMVASARAAAAKEAQDAADAGQPLAMMVNLQQLELKLYVPGDIVTRISLGYPARIRVDGLSGDFSAKVARIDDFAQFTPRDVHMPDERVRMVYGVTLALDNTAEALKPGMPADAWIRWDPDTEWPDPLSVPAR